MIVFSRLQALFPGITAIPYPILREPQTRVCWYPSAGIDWRLVTLVQELGSVIGRLVRVFFYTDIAYDTSEHTLHYMGRDIRRDRPDWGNQRVISCESLSLRSMDKSWPAHIEVLNTRDDLLRGDFTCRFFIKIDNREFESVMILEGMRIDVVCDAVGMRGPGPARLGDLGTDYILGWGPWSVFEMRRDSGISRTLFQTSLIRTVKWGLGCGGTSELRRVDRMELCREEGTSDAAMRILQKCDAPGGKDYCFGFLPELSEPAAMTLVDWTRRHQIRELVLDGLKQVSSTVAQTLAHFEGDISLDGLVAMDEQVAIALEGHPGGLSLRGIVTLTSKVARALIRHKGSISLIGLRSIEDDTAKILASCPNLHLRRCWDWPLSSAILQLIGASVGGENATVRVKGLPFCTCEIASALAAFPGSVEIETKALPDDEVVRLLAGRTAKTKFTPIPKWKRLDEARARLIVASLGHLENLSLRDAVSMTDKAASILATHPGIIDIPDRLKEVETMGIGVAKLLLRDRFLETSHIGLCLASVREVSEEAMDVLAGHHGPLFLDGLTQLTEVSATHLAKHRWLLSLNGLLEISKETAGALAGHRGGIRLNGLPRISSVVAACFTQHVDPVRLGGLRELDETVAAHYVKITGSQLHLEGLSLLSAEVAAIVAQRRCKIHLDGLITLGKAVAFALGNHRGGLSLNGLKQLTLPEAQALRGHQGQLYLNGLSHLDLDVARMLSTHRGALYMGNLRELSEEVAEALATIKSPLFLRGLVDVSEEGRRVLETKNGYAVVLGLRKIK